MNTDQKLDEVIAVAEAAQGHYLEALNEVMVDLEQRFIDAKAAAHIATADPTLVAKMARCLKALRFALASSMHGGFDPYVDDALNEYDNLFREDDPQ